MNGPKRAESVEIMFTMLGIAHIDFVPDGEKTPLQGYKLHFMEEIEQDKGFGCVPFSYFIRYEKAAAYGLNSPADMANFAPHMGKAVGLAFDRKGKLTAIEFPDTPAYPPETTEKPKKLGATA